MECTFEFVHSMNSEANVGAQAGTKTYIGQVCLNWTITGAMPSAIQSFKEILNLSPSQKSWYVRNTYRDLFYTRKGSNAGERCGLWATFDNLRHLDLIYIDWLIMLMLCKKKSQENDFDQSAITSTMEI